MYKLAGTHNAIIFFLSQQGNGTLLRYFRSRLVLIRLRHRLIQDAVCVCVCVFRWIHVKRVLFGKTKIILVIVLVQSFDLSRLVGVGVCGCWKVCASVPWRSFTCSMAIESFISVLSSIVSVHPTARILCRKWERERDFKSVVWMSRHVRIKRKTEIIIAHVPRVNVASTCSFFSFSSGKVAN